MYQAKDTLEKLIENNLLFNGYKYDLDCVPDSFLQKHVRRMLKTRRNSLSEERVGSDIFNEFILPYRGANEKFADYHQTIENLFCEVIENFSEYLTTREKVIAINSELTKILKFDLRSHALLEEPSIPEVLVEGKGSCNSLTSVAALTMRFFGIPAAIDECPVWAHRNSGHRWNAFLDDTGLWIPFSGAETNPDEFNVINDSVKAPKIFRHTFSIQKGFQPPGISPGDMPPVFQFSNRTDVTQLYVSTSDVEIYPNPDIVGNEKIIYLSVFNDQEWQIVSWAPIENGKAIFRKVGNNNIIYLPVLYKKGVTIPVAHPFILSANSMKTIVPYKNQTINMELKYHNVFYDFKWNIGLTKPGRNIELYYWENGWVLCGKYRAGEDHILRFTDVPGGALYWIKSNEWVNTWQRIFTIENGEQVWY